MHLTSSLNLGRELFRPYSALPLTSDLVILLTSMDLVIWAGVKYTLSTDLVNLTPNHKHKEERTNTLSVDLINYDTRINHLYFYILHT